jgi:hypothetical protein
VKFVSLILTTILVSCGYQNSPEESCNFYQNRHRQRVSWNSKLPIALYMHSSFPPEYAITLKNAMDRWSQAMDRTMFYMAGSANGDAMPSRDGTSVVYWLNEWEALKSNEQGRTTIYWDGSQIYEADIRINNKNFKFSISDYGEDGTVDLESLLVHELGHVLGLGHNSAYESVMNAHLANTAIRRDPQVTDMDSMRCEY